MHAENSYSKRRLSKSGLHIAADEAAQGGEYDRIWRRRRRPA